MCSSAIVAATLSVAGLTPITASPAPSSSPSSVTAAMPCGSSVGWLGCRRDGQPAGQADRVAESGGHPAFGGDGDQILQPHDLADRGGHLRRQARRQRREGRCVAAAQQPVAEPADGQVRDGRKGCRSRGCRQISRVTSSLSYGMTGSSSNRFSGRSASAHLRRYALCRRSGGQPRQHVARSQRRRPARAASADRGKSSACRLAYMRRPWRSVPPPFRRG